MTAQKMVVLIGLCLSASLLRAQTGAGDYDAKWKVVDSLLNKAGLPESALAMVNRIDAMARQEHNEGQEIKALIYRIQISKGKKEMDDTAYIPTLEAAAARAAQPMRSILQSLLANQYWYYCLQNRGRLYNRTATVAFLKNDMTTWTPEDFQSRISALYLASLQDEKLLEGTGLADYEPILIKGNQRQLRPTLFDLLAHEALGFFKRGGMQIVQPANAFVLNDMAAFADAGDFAGHVFVSSDTASLQYKALLLYQRLIRFHRGDVRPDALIDIDIDRLEFANSYSVREDVKELYKRALTRLTDKYRDLPAAAEAWYLLATHYTTAARDAKRLIANGEAFVFGGDSADLRGMVSAKAICESVLAEKDSSEGKTDCAVLLNDILEKTLNLQVERFNLPGKPFRCLVTSTNVSRIYLRLIRTDSLRQTSRSYQAGQHWNQWLRLPVYRSFTQDLPDRGDYMSHNAEIPIGSLPAGHYMLMSCTDSGWNGKQAIMTAQELDVTSIAYVSRGRDYFVVDRETGQPIDEATVQAWGPVLNTGGPNWDWVKKESYRTDAKGHFLLQKQLRFGQFFLEISRPGDDLYLSDVRSFYPYNWQSGRTADDKNQFEAGNASAYLFLDRSIYRPGQTVYFKGITITTDYDTRQQKPYAGRNSVVVLYNVNNEKIDSVAVTTDAFGSYHGVFHLPEHQLNGQFRMEEESTHGSQYFSVEEYKRPRFFVDFDRLQGSYRVGDSIRVTGKARAYAGHELDGATVSYRIERVRQYKGWTSYAFGLRSQPDWQEIGHGEAKTDAGGVFRLGFLATPDKRIPVSSDPRFNYRVSVDVTDINGETRSGSTTIVAGYTALNLVLGLPEDGIPIPADSLTSLTVDAANLSGERVPTLYHVAAYPLQAPNRLIRERLWGLPDSWVMTEAAFLDSFPHDQYREELNNKTWARGPLGWEATDTTGDRKMPLRLAAGWWVIEATATDVYGHAVKDVRYIELYDGHSGSPGSPQYVWGSGKTAETVTEPGGTARVETGSSARDVYVLRTIERPDPRQLPWRRKDDTLADRGGVFSSLALNNGKVSTVYPITEADRGGFGVVDVFVKDNRVYTRKSLIKVPWTNKELQIRYTSFRDKTEPGSAEKWGVTISGKKGEQVSAEVLAAMYDASLDQFQPHSWSAPTFYPELNYVQDWGGINDFPVSYSGERPGPGKEAPTYLKQYDRLLLTGELANSIRTVRYKMMSEQKMFKGLPAAMVDLQGEVMVQGQSIGSMDYDKASFRGNSFISVGYSGQVKEPEENAGEEVAAPPPVQVRTNFNETAFFFPDLRTDSAGAVSFSFTMPEALTRWKWMTLANTQDAAFGYSEKTIVTQKELMVQPNLPRYLREGDKINLSVKVVNLTDSEMTGQMGLALTDPTTGETADGWFVNRQPNQYFTVAAHGSGVVEFPLDIPFQYNRPVSYKIVAEAKNYSDGEEAVLPVVSNRMLVTETLPLNMPGNGVRQFKLDKLLQSGSSETLSNHALTVEFTANPAWYAVQALPYLMDYPYECAEQTWNRFYANALASQIVNSSPRLAAVFTAWRTTDTAALLSNLEKNAELKSVLLEETPWVLQGKTETQQKRNIALLFDTSRISRELESTIDRLLEMQAPDGGFAWFKGGMDDPYITQYILTGVGHLQKLQALPPGSVLAEKIRKLVLAALPYADGQLQKEYEREMGGTYPIGALPVQYLYMRSLFNDIGIPGNVFPAVNYYRKRAQKEWLSYSKYMQGMIALALFRTGDVQTARNIIASLRETAITDEEQGMYWKGMEGGYYWYQAPIETESLMIEAFHEVGGEISGDARADRQLKTWLLRQKQTHNWATTKATADACYALLMGGEDWLSAERTVDIGLGDKSIHWPGDGAGGAGDGGEAGTGYDKKVFDAPFINPSMGNITVTMKSKGSGGAGNGGTVRGGSPAWGAVYWQYFDQLDRITPAGGGKAPLRLAKRLFIQRNTDRGPVLDTIADNGTLKIGDRVVVRVELRADRNLEYVHLKDMRAACLEPVDVLSGYKWQGGLGYYETTKDASTEFFFPEVGKGTYVFEYTLVVGQTGEFSNGIASVECLYAPEFAFHTEGIRINVEGGQ